MAVVGACFGAVWFIMDTDGHGGVINGVWFFDLAQRAALWAWLWVAIHSTGNWIRRALRGKAKTTPGAAAAVGAAD